MKHKVRLVDGSNAFIKYRSSSREANRLKLLSKKYDKDPLKNPDYIKRAKENPQSAYQKHMYITRINESKLTKEEKDKQKKIDYLTQIYVRSNERSKINRKLYGSDWK